MIYVNTVSRRKYVFADSKMKSKVHSPYHGYGLSPRELDEVCDVMSQYSQLSSSDKLVTKVDLAFNMSIPDAGWPSHIAGRRWTPTNRSCEILSQWINHVRETVVEPCRTKMSSRQFTEPLPWCFQEVGFARGTLRRVHQHQVLASTTYMLGIFFSTVEYLFPETFVIESYGLIPLGEAEDSAAFRG